MDLNTVTAVLSPQSRAEFPTHAAGDAWLAGGTWLFSEPQPHVSRLVDLGSMSWRPLVATDTGLEIAATCTIATLEAYEVPRAWRAAPLIAQCCQSFLASFKIQGVATVGGNLCMALPAGPMISLCVALDGACTIWTPEGGERRAAMVDFVQGPQSTALRPGEILRSVTLPAPALRRRTAFRRIALSRLGRSAALLIGTCDDDGRFALTVTAATRRPVRLDFGTVPTAADLTRHIDKAVPAALYFDDVHGAPDWRKHMTEIFAEEIRTELA